MCVDQIEMNPNRFLNEQIILPMRNLRNFIWSETVFSSLWREVSWSACVASAKSWETWAAPSGSMQCRALLQGFIYTFCQVVLVDRGLNKMVNILQIFSSALFSGCPFVSPSICPRDFQALPWEHTKGLAWNLACWYIVPTFRTA